VNLKELRTLQNKIISRFPKTKDDRADLLDNFHGVLFGTFGDNAYFLARSGSDKIIDHSEVADYIAGVERFYSQVTPEEIALLNAPAYQCLNCEDYFTEDEFPDIPYPADGQIKVIYGEYDQYARPCHAYCKNCIHKVSLIKTRGKSRPGYVYLAETDIGYKIGCSREVDKRMVAIGRDYGFVKFVHSIPAEDMFIAEAHLHLIYFHKHITRELFHLSVDDVAHIVGMK
jgi:hypothetical protein